MDVEGGVVQRVAEFVEIFGRGFVAGVGSRPGVSARVAISGRDDAVECQF